MLNYGLNEWAGLCSVTAATGGYWLLATQRARNVGWSLLLLGAGILSTLFVELHIEREFVVVLVLAAISLAMWGAGIWRPIDGIYFSAVTVFLQLHWAHEELLLISGAPASYLMNYIIIVLFAALAQNLLADRVVFVRSLLSNGLLTFGLLGAGLLIAVQLLQRPLLIHEVIVMLVLSSLVLAATTREETRDIIGYFGLPIVAYSLFGRSPEISLVAGAAAVLTIMALKQYQTVLVTAGQTATEEGGVDDELLDSRPVRDLPLRNHVLLPIAAVATWAITGHVGSVLHQAIVIGADR